MAKMTSGAVRRYLMASAFVLAPAIPAYAQAAPEQPDQNTASQANALASASQAGGEIIVTAQNRAQRLTDVPISITAVGAAAISDNHIRDFADIALLSPGYVSGTNYGFNRNSSIRGISNNSFGFADDPSIAMYVDGVYQGRGSTGMQVNALYDVNHVEVVKGPQATLFGRSSIAGAISIVNNQPTQKFEASLDVGLGSYDRAVIKGVVNVPVTSDFAIRAAFNSEDERGYIKNLNGGNLEPLHDRAGRIIARYTGISGLEATLRFSYERRRQHGSTPADASLPAFTADITTVGDENYSNFTIFETGLRLAYEIGPGLTLTSDTSYRRVKNRYLEDYDAVPQVVGGPYSQNSRDALFQEDLKLSYHHGETAVTVGASLFDENLSAFVGNWVDHTFAFTGVPGQGLLRNDYSQAFFEQGSFDGRFHGWSVFADATIPVAEGLTITGGVRYNYDAKRYTLDIPDPATLAVNAGKAFAGAYYNWGFYTSPPISADNHWTNTSFRAAVNYDLGDHNVVYASISQGWKSGGIDTFRVVTPAGSGFSPYFGQNASAFGGTPNVYAPEKSINYEVGIKGAIFDRRLRYELSAYHYIYRDLQVAVIQNGGSVIQNVGRARGDGVELNLSYSPNRSWDFYANGAYNHTKILSYSADPRQVGYPLNQAPKFTSAAGVTHKIFSAFGLPGNLFFGASVTQRSKYRTDAALFDGVRGYALVNLRAGYTAPDDKYSITVFADNVADKFTYSRFNPVTPFTYPVARYSVIGSPRIIGVDFHYNF